MNKIISRAGDLEIINNDRPFLTFNTPHSAIYRGQNSGDVFVGEVQNGKKSGFGRLICANGVLYEGYWDNNMYNG